MKSTKIPYSQMVIKYPGGAKQVVKPGASFAGDWQGLANHIAGMWYRDDRGQIMNVPFELR